MKKLKITINLLAIIYLSLSFINYQKANAKTRYYEVSKERDKMFRAGAATTNITPPIGEEAVDEWYAEKQDFFVGGGTLSKKSVANHVHDDFHARCLIIDDSETKLVFVVIDNVIVGRKLYDEAKRIIKEETGIPVENILMSVTHSHSVGSARSGDFPFNRYQKFLIRRVADVVRIALNNMKPARIGWAVGYLPDRLFVRRWKMNPESDIPNPFGGQDQVRMNPGVGNPNLVEPAAEPDSEVSFISVQSTDGNLIALLANYSLHYVGGIPSGHISADYFALFADRIQELLGADRQNPPFVGIMSNGTSGDVNNINYGGEPEKNVPYEKMKIVAEDVAREVFRVHNNIEFHDWVPLRVGHSELALKIRKPDKRVGPHRSEKFYLERVLKMVEWPEYVNVILHTFRIGNLGVAAIPFETFSKTGLEIKKKSPFEITFTIGLANGAYGYLPTPEQHELGGYETWMSINRVEKKHPVRLLQHC